MNETTGWTRLTAYEACQRLRVPETAGLPYARAARQFGTQQLARWAIERGAVRPGSEPCTPATGDQREALRRVAATRRLPALVLEHLVSAVERPESKLTEETAAATLAWLQTQPAR